VVRIGDTVRRPAGPWTESVDALLRHLERVGFPGAPRALGRDTEGRQVLEYVPGEVGDDHGTYPPAQLREIGALLRDFHNAAAGFVPPAGAVWNTPIPPDRVELVCHHDPAPWNLVRSARGWVLIDWDAAGPGSRLWDLAYAAQSMAGLGPHREPADCADRLRCLVDGYDPAPDVRADLPVTLGRRAGAMVHLLETGAHEQRQPWARIWLEDGPYWQAVAAFLDAEVSRWTAALHDTR
jgi:Ser/Thr protein kinase RdoA (MazF antagonist)